MLTIALVSARLDLAERFEREFTGKNQHGIQLCDIGRHVIVNDGTDRWLTEREEYDRAVAEIVSNILEGQYDNREEQWPESDGTFYGDLCDECDCSYSRIGQPHDMRAIAFLDVDEATREEIVDALGIELDYAAWKEEEEAK